MKSIRSKAASTCAACAGHEQRDPIASSLIEVLATQRPRQRVESPVANPGEQHTSYPKGSTGSPVDRGAGRCCAPQPGVCVRQCKIWLAPLAS